MITETVECRVCGIDIYDTPEARRAHAEKHPDREVTFRDRS